MELLDEDICSPLLVAYASASHHLGGMQKRAKPGWLLVASPDDDDSGMVSVRPISDGDPWLQKGKPWVTIHMTPRRKAYFPSARVGGPALLRLPRHTYLIWP